jgi:hypothetical protein
VGGATRCGRSAGTASLFDGDLERRGNTIHHPDGDLTNGSATWSTVAEVARPRMRCLLHGDESEEEVQRRVWRGPRALCLHGGEGETACERSGFDGFHSVRWCLLGQRHYGDRFCIAVVFSAWCVLFFSTSYRRGIVFRRRLPR